MSVEVSPLAESDIPGAVQAIQEAFADDPYNNWIFDKTKFDARRNAASLAIRCRWGMRNALFYVAKERGSDRVLGVAMWLAPRPADQQRTWHDWFEDWRLYFNQVGMNVWYGRGGLSVKAAQENAHATVWTDARGYYFLNIMVVIPEAQGRGIGRQLVAVVTDRADAEQMNCYLESSRDRPNMQIYARMGFEFAESLDCDDEGALCKLFCMVRKPKLAASSETRSTSIQR